MKSVLYIAIEPNPESYVPYLLLLFYLFILITSEKRFRTSRLFGLLALFFFLRLELSSVMGAAVLFLSIFAFKKKEEESRSARKSGTHQQKPLVEQLKEQNERLKKRILFSENDFLRLAEAVEALLTLNPIELFHGLTEHAAKITAARVAYFFQYRKGSGNFQLAVRYTASRGFLPPRNEILPDKLFQLLVQSRSVLTLREILHNEVLHRIWQKSAYKGFIYCPVVEKEDFFGILVLDQIPLFNLNRETVHKARILAQIAGKIAGIGRSHQHLIQELKRQEAKILPEPQQFLRAFALEFKRAKRNRLPLCLLLVSVEQPDGSSAELSKELRERLKNTCRRNLREIDPVFSAERPGMYWIILPHTHFKGLACVMERLKLTLHLELGSSSTLACRFGFSFMDRRTQKPMDMIKECKDSLHLHRVVEEMLVWKTRKDIETNPKISSE